MIGRWAKRAVASVAVAAFVGGASVSGGVQAASCPSEQVVQAMQVRLLQNELMVAALQCRAVQSYDYQGKYNAFLHQFNGSLLQNANVLKDHFRRSFGASHQTQLDRYMTRIANDAGQRGMNPGYCQQMAPLFEKVLLVKGTDLTSFSKQNLPVAVTRDGC
jgi:hypothetical protein